MAPVVRQKTFWMGIRAPTVLPCSPGHLLTVTLFVLLCGCGWITGLTGKPTEQPLAVPEAPPSLRDLEVAIREGTEYLLRRQHPDGYWCGTLYNDSSVTGLYILLAHYTDNVRPERDRKAARYLLDSQLEDGSWEQYPGSGGNLDVTLINYTALRLAGTPPDSEALLRAHTFIMANQGTEQANFFTKILLALFGQVPWEDIPWITCGLVQHQDLIYREGFPRVILIPYMVLYENRKVLDLPPFFQPLEKSADEKTDGNPLRVEQSITPMLDRMKDPEDKEKCIQWILERQEKDGTWAGIVQVTAFSAMALKSSRRPEFNDRITRAVKGVETYQVETPEIVMQQFSVGPVMDTAHALLALRLSGIPGKHASIRKAAQWLAAKQSLREGDWKYGNPEGEPGGWPFEFHNTWYPDVDDTAMVLHALSHLDQESLLTYYPVMDRGLNWMLSMQNREGGFPVWDKNNWIVFNVLKDIFDVGDYSHNDITARVLVTLSSMKSLEHYADREDMERAIHRARAFLFFKQKKGEYWYGRWGANYTYGTGQVLTGLMLTGSKPDGFHVERAVHWLFSVQNPDGGWGESLLSYETGTFEPAESTVAQSSSVLMGLLRAGLQEDPRFWKGLAYLLKMQEMDGSWEDHLFYAVNVPRAWYGRYELLSTQAALILLATYRQEVLHRHAVDLEMK